MKITSLNKKIIPSSIIFIYLAFFLPLIFIATKNFRLIIAFNIDAFILLKAVDKIVNHYYWATGYFRYGDAYFYLAAAIGFIYKIFHSIEYQEIVIIMRSINLIFGVLTIDALWRLTRNYFSLFVSVCVLLLMVTSQIFLFWSLYVHPDIMQIYFVVMVIYYACKMVDDSSKKNIILSSVFAGLAFGTKYIGILMLPTILFAYMMFHLKRPDFKWTFLLGTEFWKSFFLSGAVFVFSYFLTCPSHFYHPKLFLKILEYQRLRSKLGFVFIADKNSLLWLPVMYAESFLGRVTLVLFFGYLVFISVRFISDPGRFRRNIHPNYIPLFWACFFLIYLFIEVNHRIPRFLFPIFPFIILYAVLCLEKIGQFMKNSKLLSRWSNIIVAGLFCGALIPKIILGYNFFIKEYHKMDTPNIQAGLWLENNFPESTRILCDFTAYIPIKFKNWHPSWILNHKKIESFKPDIIVIHQFLAEQYGDESKAKLFWVRGEKKYLESFYFYRDLREGKLPNFKLIKDFGEVKIYSNRDLPSPNKLRGLG